MKNNIVAIIQARINSSRLHGKVLKMIGGISFLELQIRRLKKSKKLNRIVLAIPKDKRSKSLIKLAKKLDIICVLGSEKNLLSRYKQAAIAVKADYIVRVTSDCPLIDPILLDRMVMNILEKKYDIITNVIPPTWPDGLDLNIFTKTLLLDAEINAVLHSDKEHVVPWMWRNSSLKLSNKYRGYNLKCSNDYSHLRWTLDNALDLTFFSRLAERLTLNELESMTFIDFIDFFKNNEDLIKINTENIRDSGYNQSLKLDNENK